MRRRCLLLGTGALVLIGLAGAPLLLGWLISSPGAAITPENCARLREGMTEQEVEALFGVPAGNYSGKSAAELEFTKLLLEVLDAGLEQVNSRNQAGSVWTGPPPDRRTCHMWVGSRVAVLVEFKQGKLQAHHEESVAEQKVSRVDHLRGLLPW